MSSRINQREDSKQDIDLSSEASGVFNIIVEEGKFGEDGLWYCGCGKVVKARGVKIHNRSRHHKKWQKGLKHLRQVDGKYVREMVKCIDCGGEYLDEDEAYFQHLIGSKHLQWMTNKELDRMYPERLKRQGVPDVTFEIEHKGCKHFTNTICHRDLGPKDEFNDALGGLEIQPRNPINEEGLHFIEVIENKVAKRTKDGLIVREANGDIVLTKTSLDLKPPKKELLRLVHKEYKDVFAIKNSKELRVKKELKNHVNKHTRHFNKYVRDGCLEKVEVKKDDGVEVKHLRIKKEFNDPWEIRTKLNQMTVDQRREELELWEDDPNIEINKQQREYVKAKKEALNRDAIYKKDFKKYPTYVPKGLFKEEPKNHFREDDSVEVLQEKLNDLDLEAKNSLDDDEEVERLIKQMEEVDLEMEEKKKRKKAKFKKPVIRNRRRVARNKGFECPTCKITIYDYDVHKKDPKHRYKVQEETYNMKMRELEEERKRKEEEERKRQEEMKVDEESDKESVNSMDNVEKLVEDETKAQILEEMKKDELDKQGKPKKAFRKSKLYRHYGYLRVLLNEEINGPDGGRDVEICDGEREFYKRKDQRQEPLVKDRETFNHINNEHYDLRTVPDIQEPDCEPAYEWPYIQTCRNMTSKELRMKRKILSQSLTYKEPIHFGTEGEIQEPDCDPVIEEPVRKRCKNVPEFEIQALRRKLAIPYDYEKYEKIIFPEKAKQVYVPSKVKQRLKRNREKVRQRYNIPDKKPEHNQFFDNDLGTAPRKTKRKTSKKIVGVVDYEAREMMQFLEKGEEQENIDPYIGVCFEDMKDGYGGDNFDCGDDNYDDDIALFK